MGLYEENVAAEKLSQWAGWSYRINVLFYRLVPYI